MTTETIAAPDAVKSESHAPVADVKTETPTQETPTPETAKAEDGTEQVKPEEKELSPAEQRRKERNRERWREMQERQQNAERRAASAEAELAKLRNAPKLDRSQFEDPDEYLAALSAQKVRESFAGDHEAVAKSAREEAKQAVFEAWDAVRADARERIPDFDQYVNGDTPIHARMARPLVESEHAAEIAYYLGRNREEANQLAHDFETNPARALIRFGKLEAMVSKPAPKTHSSAPKPPPVLSGSSSPPAFDPKTASVSDMRAHLVRMKVIRA